VQKNDSNGSTVLRTTITAKQVNAGLAGQVFYNINDKIQQIQRQVNDDCLLALPFARETERVEKYVINFMKVMP